VSAASESFRTAYSEVMAETSRAVVERFRDQRLRNVLLISNHNSYEILSSFVDHGIKPGAQELRRRDRAKIDTLVMYLQRICAKNDTTSRFGPFTLGRMDWDAPPIAWECEVSPQATAFYSHWAAEEIAAAISLLHRNALWMRPRRRTGAFLEGTKLQVLRLEFDPTFIGEAKRGIEIRQPEEIDQSDARILLMCTGRHSIYEIFGIWKQRSGEQWDQFADRVDRLSAAHALTLDLEVPVGIPDPIARILEDLPDTVELSNLRNELSSTARALAEFPDAGLERRNQLFQSLDDQFARLTGKTSARGLGKTYADRSLISEECHRALRGLTIGGALVAAIEKDLAPVYDLFLLGPRRRLRAEQSLLAKWWCTRYRPDDAISPIRFLEDFVADSPQLEEDYTSIDHAIEELNERVSADLLPDECIAEPTVEISAQRLSEVLQHHSERAPAVCNADLMFIAESADSLARGSFQVLIGECHAVRELLSHGPMGSFLQNFDPTFSEQVAAHYRSLLRSDEVVADVIRAHTDKTLAQVALPGFDLEVQGLSPKNRDDVLALYDLQVVSTESGLRLYAPKIGRFVRLMGPPLGTFQLKRNPFNVFGWPRHYTGPPIKTETLAHAPRLVLGRVVLQREQWRFPAEEFSKPIAYGSARFDDIPGGEFIRAKSVQRKFGLPRRVFVKLPTEAKPVYLDFDAPLLVRQVTRLARHAPGNIELTEMLPGPMDLWLPGRDGPVTCELRVGLFSDPADAR
jgi:Lantibiotic dehydratase, N terminus